MSKLINRFNNNKFNLSKKNKKERFNNRNTRNTKNNKLNNSLNIYDNTLQSCMENNMANGSWDNLGKCSELDGGVHQICIKNISKKTPYFSKKTGQSNWSNKRGNNNHCVCLGAWSLYNSKHNTTKDVLKCDAIPKASLSNNYISKFSEGWNKWNGLELDNQIVNGVESLVNNCYKPVKYPGKSQKLKKNYCNFAKNINVLQNSPSNLYNTLCK